MVLGLEVLGLEVLSVDVLGLDVASVDVLGLGDVSAQVADGANATRKQVTTTDSSNRSRGHIRPPRDTAAGP